MNKPETPVSQPPQAAPKPTQPRITFDELGLAPNILKAVTEKGYSSPSPIQEKAIPEVLAHRDVMAAAQTGTGKTAGFTLPLLHNLLHSNNAVKANQCRALVLTPTRELAAQVADSVSTYSRYLKMNSTVVFGGVKINPQMQRLRSGVDVLIATPGRLLDLANQNAIKFDQLEILVLDEADRMLDMGFINDIKRVLRLLPTKRQNLLFSATFSPVIRDLAHGLLNSPVEVSVAPPNSTAKKVKQLVHPINKSAKAKAMVELIKKNNWHQVLVFTKTKHGANRLTKQLDAQGIAAAAIHGNKSQGARTRALNEFKQNKIQALIATDIAARGLDIEQLPQVVNFDLPNVAEDYVHRIGRTGRAGAEGHAISLVCHEDFDLLQGIEQLIQTIIPREDIKGFEAAPALPESKLKAPHKPKKPKKPRQSSANDDANKGENRRSGNGPNANKKPNNRRRNGSNANGHKSNTGNKPNQSGNKRPAGAKPKNRPAHNSSNSSAKNSANK